MSRHFRPPLWTVPVAIAALVALLGWWGNQKLRRTLQDELKAALVSTLDANVTALEIWTTNQTKLAMALADEPMLRTMSLQLLAKDPAAQSTEVAHYLRSRLDGLGYRIAHIVDTNFVILANSRGGPVGVEVTISEELLVKFSELFNTGHPVIITPFKPRRGGLRRPLAEGRDRLGAPVGAARPPRPRDITLMQVAAPIRDDSGVVRGALALVINPDQEFTRILSVARAGKTGETYVFDREGLMLSRSRFDGQLKRLGLIENEPGVSSAATLRLTDPGHALKPGDKPPSGTGPLIQLVANAFTGLAGVDVEPSRDYRGVPVVGAWRWEGRNRFGVVTQLDADEAFRPLRVLDLLFIMLCLLLLLCAIGMFLFSYLGVLWKRRLSEAELKLKQLGQYTLEDKIGEGAMGAVYRARHALMRRSTAVKLLLPERADPASIRRFESEVRLTCQLTHPNTIQVYDYGHTPEGVFYYAMELLDGLTLHQLVTQFGAQPQSRVIYIMTQVCDALAEAHALGLVHRDIKPGNVFLCDRGGVPDWVKVLDFGLVRAYREGQRSPLQKDDSRAGGTPLFMPPEAFRDSGISDPRSDIYSLGAVGYFLLTARYLFEANSDVELYQKHASEPPVPPSKRTPNPISAELEETILRCLEKEPNLRPHSVAELREMLSTCPQAQEWGLAARTAWWARFNAQGRSPAQTQSADRIIADGSALKMSLIDHVKAPHPT